MKNTKVLDQIKAVIASHDAGRMLKEAKLKLVRRSSTGCEYQANEKS